MSRTNFMLITEAGTPIKLKDYCFLNGIDCYSNITCYFGSKGIHNIPEASLQKYLKEKAERTKKKNLWIKKIDGKKVRVSTYFTLKQTQQHLLLRRFMTENELETIDELILTFKGRTISLYHMELSHDQLGVIYRIMTERDINTIEYDDLIVYLKCLGYIKEGSNQPKRVRK